MRGTGGVGREKDRGGINEGGVRKAGFPINMPCQDDAGSYSCNAAEV